MRGSNMFRPPREGAPLSKN